MTANQSFRGFPFLSPGRRDPRSLGKRGLERGGSLDMGQSPRSGCPLDLVDPQDLALRLRLRVPRGTRCLEETALYVTAAENHREGIWKTGGGRYESL